MVSVLEREVSFAALSSGWSADVVSVPADSSLAGWGGAPVDLVVLDRKGWLDLAGQLGWDDACWGQWNGLLDRWLRGADRRALLDAARSGGGDFQKVARDWLVPERVSRLAAILDEAGCEQQVYPFCYALGQAFDAVESALAHTGPRVVFTDGQPGMSPVKLPDNAGVGVEDA